MTRHWVTTGSTNPEAVVNPFAAACTEWAYVPETVHLLENPGVADRIDRTRELLTAVVEAHGGDPPTVELTSVDVETDFEAVVGHYRTAVEGASDGDEVVVDVTPGRKFVSAIAFQAGIRYGADRVSYLYVDSGRLFGRVYADLPRSATTLYDFAEVF